MNKIKITILSVIVFLLIFLNTTAFGQQTEISSTKHFSVGITFSPDYCFRTLNIDQAGQWVVDLRDSLEQAKFGFTTGLSFRFELSKKINIESGLKFSDKGEQMKDIELIFLEPEPNDPVKSTLIYHYQYLDIPIKVNYFIFNKKPKIFISAGVSTNIFLNNRITSILEYADGSTERNNSANISQLDKVNIAGLCGLGIDFDISRKFNIRYEQIFRHSLTPIINVPLKQYSYSIGANIGLFYKL